LRASEGIRTPE